MIQCKLLTHLLEEIDHFKLALFPRRVSLHLSIGVIHDCEKHVQKDEKREENVDNEIDWSKNAVGMKQL
jgi:hypothetical protein